MNAQDLPDNDVGTTPPRVRIERFRLGRSGSRVCARANVLICGVVRIKNVSLMAGAMGNLSVRGPRSREASETAAVFVGSDFIQELETAMIAAFDAMGGDATGAIEVAAAWWRENGHLTASRANR